MNSTEKSGKSALSILNGLDARDVNLWNHIVKEYCGNEPMMLPAYLGLFCRTPFERSFCVWYGRNNGGIVYPFILRELRSLTWCPSELSCYCDLVTPYGYGGPYQYGELSENDICEFWFELDDWLKGRRAVSEFIRFSLELTQPKIAYPGAVVFKQNNIAKDLGRSDADIWMGYHHKVRKNVKRAEHSGLQIEIDRNGARIHEFLETYYSTMARREADNFYFFSPDLFDCLNRSLLGNYIYFYVLNNSKIISSELVLYSNVAAYSFLGGTDESAYELRPNDLLKHEIIKWGVGSGLRWFIIGGGYHEDDGIYRYKKSFAPEGEFPFFVGQRVLDSGVFGDLIISRRNYENANGRDWHPSENFFPPYRAQ